MSASAAKGFASRTVMARTMAGAFGKNPGQSAA